MADEIADILIIGCGVEGASIAYACAHRSMGKIVVLERSTVASGNTAKSSAIVRCHYGIPVLAAMAWEGLEFLERAPDVLGRDVGFTQTGYVLGVGGTNYERLRRNVENQQAAGVETEVVDTSDVALMWPEADLDGFAGFAYEPRAGYGDAYQTAHAFATRARELGADIRQRSAVVEILVSADGSAVRGVRGPTGSIDVGQVVVAAGPWSARLVGAVGIDLPIHAQREQIMLAHPGVDIGTRPVFSDLVSLQYVRTEKSGHLLVGNTDLSDPEVADPDNYKDAADDDYIARTVPKVIKRFPGLKNIGLASSYSGCYDVTPDYNPIIGRTGVDGLYVAAGFSGHGFKISPAVGELVAELLAGSDDQRTVERADTFSLERFSSGKLLVSPDAYAGAGEMR